MKKNVISIVAVILVLIILVALLIPKDSVTIKNVKSEKELYELASSYGYYYDDVPDILKIFIGGPLVPFYFLTGGRSYMSYSAKSISNGFDMVEEASMVQSMDDSVSFDAGSSTRDYSTTNIQVENVDEADVTKTDGYYIYSLSNSDVIITDVNDINNIKIASRIPSVNYEVPVDLILYKDKLVVIYEGQGINDIDDTYSWRYYYNQSTLVKIFDIKDRYNPKQVKSYEFDCNYYTSRCIDNRLYVISSGYIQYNYSDKKAFHSYYDGLTLKEIDLKDIKYIDKINSNRQTIISYCDLDNVNDDVQITDYLFDVNNAYVSQKAMYVLQNDYSYYDDLDVGKLLKSIFSLKGIFGLADFESSRENSGRNTKIIKFNINNNGTLSYACSNKFEGQTLNQYSVDEKNGYLRVAVNLGWNAGAKVLVFDDKLKQVGQTEVFGKNEQLYSSRFVGDRAYVVTYRNTDPFFVIDLSDVNKPKLLGELKIPGYSSYLHPYDENHLIGFGMETKEVVNRDSYGRVSSTSTYTVGMKMALFDVTDVTNPKELAKTVIGDSRTTSAILSNPKALLFSKERNLIAIPANRYDKDFESNSSDYYSSSTSSYMNYWKDYVAEGYLVYDITLEDGFKLRGSIEHPDCYKHVTDIRVSNGEVYIDYDLNSKYVDDYSYRYYYRPSILIRGIYIDNNLYTVSQKAIYVNDLKTLKAIDAISLDKE